MPEPHNQSILGQNFFLLVDLREVKSDLGCVGGGAGALKMTSQEKKRKGKSCL